MGLNSNIIELQPKGPLTGTDPGSENLEDHVALGRPKRLFCVCLTKPYLLLLCEIND